MQAFDPIAKDYDQTFTDTHSGRYQRERVYHYLKKSVFHQLPASAAVLELSCGTGEDAIWLAQQGYHVLATDIAEEMVAKAQEKVKRTKESSKVRVQQLAAQDISQVDAKDFDLIFSNFAGLNCLNPQEWQTFIGDLANKLPVGGHCAIVMLGRFCWWETFYFLLKGQWTQAWRRRSKQAVRAMLSADEYVDIWYYSPKDIQRYCGETFGVSLLRPIGLMIPPSYLDQGFQRFPALFQWLYHMEKIIGNNRFMAWMADHYLLVLRRQM